MAYVELQLPIADIDPAARVPTRLEVRLDDAAERDALRALWAGAQEAETQLAGRPVRDHSEVIRAVLHEVAEQLS